MTEKQSSTTDAARDERIQRVMGLCSAAQAWTLKEIQSATPFAKARLPVRVAGSLPYQGSNIPVLLAQLEENHPGVDVSPIFGTAAMWGAVNRPVITGSKALGLIMSARIPKKKPEEKDAAVAQGAAVDEDEDDSQFFTLLKRLPTFGLMQTAGSDFAYTPGLKSAVNAVDLILKAEQEAHLAIQEANARQRHQKRLIQSEETMLIACLSGVIVNAFANDGRMGGYTGSWPAAAIESVARMDGGKIMRPWGIAFKAALTACPEVGAALQSHKTSYDKAREERAADPLSRYFAKAKPLELAPEPTPAPAEKPVVVPEEVVAKVPAPTPEKAPVAVTPKPRKASAPKEDVAAAPAVAVKPEAVAIDPVKRIIAEALAKPSAIQEEEFTLSWMFD